MTEPGSRPRASIAPWIGGILLLIAAIGLVAFAPIAQCPMLVRDIEIIMELTPNCDPADVRRRMTDLHPTAYEWECTDCGGSGKVTLLKKWTSRRPERLPK